MKNLATVLLSLIVFQSFAQGSTNALQNLQGPSRTNSFRSAFEAVNSRGQWQNATWNSTVKGSPLVLENNAKLVIFTNDNKVYKIENGNYNSKSDKLVTEYTKDSIYVFGDVNIKYAKLNDDVLKKIKDSKTKKSRYYFILSQGEKITFAKGYFGRIQEGTINVMTKQKTSNDKFRIDDKYFISKDNATVEEFKLKKKYILQLMSDAKKEISVYVKENNLSYKEEEDVIQIMKYYNSL